MQEVNNQDRQEPSTEKKSFFKISKTLIAKIIYLIFLLVLILSVSRIPYIGQTIDSIVFEFCFGYAKYILYIYLFLFLIAKIFNIKWKPLYSKRVCLFSVLTTCFCSLLLGGLNLSIFPNSADSTTYYTNEIFYNNMLNYNKQFVFGFNNYIDGGFIGAILTSISGVFMIILAIILVILLYFVLFRRQWQRLKQKIFSLKKKSKNNVEENKHRFELSEEKDGSKDFIDKKESIQSSDNNLKSMLSYLKQSRIPLLNKCQNKEINKKQIYDKFNNFLKEYNINVSSIKSTESEQSFNIIINLEDDSIEKFEKSKNHLYDLFSNNTFSIIKSNDVIAIKYEKKEKLINEIVYEYLSQKITSEHCFNICLNSEHKPIEFNFENNSMFALSSNSNELLYPYINALISHVALNFDSDSMKIYYLNLVNNNIPIINLDVGVSKKVSSLDAIKKFFEILKEEIYEIQNELKQRNISSIYESHDLRKKYKTRIIIFNDFDTLYHSNKNLFINITKLAKDTRRFGITFIFVDNSKDAVTFKEFNYGIILGIDMNRKIEKEITDKASSKIIRTYQGILYNTNTKEKNNVLIPKLSIDELEIIKRFFKNVLDINNQ